MKRKIIALGLVLSMALSLTACGNSFNKHTKKISKILSDLGYEEEDEDYLLDTMDEDGDSDEDGFYASSTNKTPPIAFSITSFVKWKPAVGAAIDPSVLA